MVIKTTVTCEI